MSTASIIIAVLGALFIAASLVRLAASGNMTPQAKTWLIIGSIFSLVAAWLWLYQPGMR
jgi:uncharacterized membrane protein HdeD (DUF308 family)